MFYDRKKGLKTALAGAVVLGVLLLVDIISEFFSFGDKFVHSALFTFILFGGLGVLGAFLNKWINWLQALIIIALFFPATIIARVAIPFSVASGFNFYLIALIVIFSSFLFFWKIIKKWLNKPHDNNKG